MIHIPQPLVRTSCSKLGRAITIGQPGDTIAVRSGEGKELVEDLGAVLGTGGALRVVLDRDDWKSLVAQALDAAVVEVALADVPAGLGGQGLGVDLELVVLGGDIDSTGHLVADRVVAAMMAKAQP